ncbi:MAG TPA: glycine--tRNA ligase [Candidatus Dormibacteraeota bacterium]|nr:glycine--tRNA ligase [Candidatus Dormibacteraeota bacterium]
MEKLVSLAKRRGFFFQSSEIYGGIQGVYDSGPLGVALRNNIKRAWWRTMVELRDDVVGIDAGIIMNPRVWEASGHVQNFTDPLVECKKCHQRFRADQVRGSRHEEDGGEFTEARQFNLMFKTFVGPAENSSTQVYLRPETAQGIFVNFANVLNSTRLRPPFGIAQIGKAFRNEITPGNSIFRLREFEQMELEYFVPPADELKWLDHWKDERLNWYLSLGIRREHLRLRPHGKDELAHYARGAFDVEYEFPFGWSELEGIAARGDFDLAAHQKASGRDLSYFDDIRRERYIPHVVEPSAGVDRTMLTLMIDAYHEEEVRGEQRVVLRFDPRVAPIQVAILPLSRKEPLLSTAQRVEHELRPYFRTEYDDTQSIGKRYRRQDEIGTPYAITIDFETTNDQAATIRARDAMTQERIPLARLREALGERLHAGKEA